jgi:hypothetical protein
MAIGIVNNMNALGFGGGGDYIKILSPIFYIKDLTVVSGGYFIDSSGNNKQIQAAQTTVPNDSLILLANDATIIAAVTAAGCYSQYYTDNSHPKTVLITNISPCYRDYGYFGYIEKKNFFFCSTTQTAKRNSILDILKLEILALSSIQTATPAQVSGVYQCAVGKYAYIDYGNWGNQAIQKVNATLTDHTLSSTGYLANTTYNIQLFSVKGDNGFKKISCSNVKLGGNLNLADLPQNLNFLHFQSLANLTVTGTLADLPQNLSTLNLHTLANLTVTGTLADLPSGLTYLSLNTLSNLTVTGTLADLPRNLSTLNLSALPNLSVTGTLADLPSGLTSLNLYNLTNLTVTGTLADLPRNLTYLLFQTLNYLTVTGTLADLPRNLTFLQFTNILNMSVTGDLANLPSGLTTLSLSILQYLTVTGNVNNIPASLSNILVLQNINNSNISYEGGVIPSWAAVTITIQNSWTETELRTFLINWSTTAGTGTKTCNFAGNNAAIHVNLVDDSDLYNAIQILISKGKTLMYNQY